MLSLKDVLMQMDRARLQAAMNARKMTDEQLSTALKARGYEVEPRKIRRWRTKGLQPSSDRIPLIEQVLGYTLTPPKRERRASSTTIAVA